LYHSKCKRVLVSGGSDGNIIHWHCNSGKYLSKINEDNNQILAMDFNLNGTFLATAG
jgi:WD40 repeat protein